MGIGSFFGTGGLMIGLAIGLVFVGGSYWFSDKLAVKAAGAQPVTEQEAPELYAIVRELAQRDGIPDAQGVPLARSPSPTRSPPAAARTTRWSPSRRACSRCSTRTSCAACSPTS